MVEVRARKKLREQPSTNESRYLLGTKPVPDTGGGTLMNQFLKSLQLPVHHCRHRWNLLGLFYREWGCREAKQLVQGHIAGKSWRWDSSPGSDSLFPAFKPEALLSSLRFPQIQSCALSPIV